MSQLRSIWLIKSGLGLRELRAVLAVAELGSFRRAAAELGYTQSALSHQVAAVEAALGVPLSHRPGGRAQVRLTPAGEAVCRRGRRVLREVEAVAADGEEAQRGASVRLRVGVSQTAAAEIMPAALHAFRAEHPGVEVVLSEEDESDESAGWRDALRKGDLDLAFSHYPEPDEFVEAVPLLEDPWVILTRRDSAMAELERPGVDVLDGLELVAWTHRGGAGGGGAGGQAGEAAGLPGAPGEARHSPSAHHGHPRPGRRLTRQPGWEDGGPETDLT